MIDPLTQPLVFAPVYHVLVWGGRRMESWRSNLPEGPIGESWDLADHERGRSVVASGPLSGTDLGTLMQTRAQDLVGKGYTGTTFPLMVKLIDAKDRLSVQVHPDDDLARQLGVGDRGKTESWYICAEGGEIFQGVTAGTDRGRFEAVLAAGDTAAIERAMNRFTPSANECFHLPARSMHAIGSETLLFEVQQTCDATFRVYDWGRCGLDGKPRPLHIAQAMRTIDFDARSSGPVKVAAQSLKTGEVVRNLVDCPYYSLQERRLMKSSGGGDGRCSIIIALSEAVTVATQGGSIQLPAMSTCLVPALAGTWTVTAAKEASILIAQPRLA